MREPKKHWKVKVTALWGAQYAVCGLLTTKFANKKRAVTCKTCARILAGYQTKERVNENVQSIADAAGV